MVRATRRAYPNAGNNQPVPRRDVVQFDEEDESPFVGLLQIEAAEGHSVS
jgi:hypothetical protein